MFIKKLRSLLSKTPVEIIRIILRKTLSRTKSGLQSLNPADISLKRFLRATRVPRDSTKAKDYLEGITGNYFTPFDGEKATIWQDSDGDVSASQTIGAADMACERIFEFLGSGPVRLPSKIDWHQDYKSGKTWPKLPINELRLTNIEDDSDVKIPWELSRFQHLVAMGKAYALTGDEKYAVEFVAQVDGWLTENPCGIGVNWACTMDVAIRAVNWIWAYNFFKHSQGIGDEFWLRFFHSLYVHGRFIRSHLEYAPVRGNHYLSNIVGLVYLGAFFIGAKQGRKWLLFAVGELEKEMMYQVFPDGVDHEGSTSYQRLVTELFVSAMILAERNGQTFSTSFMGRLEKMFDFIQGYTKPNGTTPLFGDADDGRLHIFSEETKRNINDHRYLLAVGAVLFRRSDFKRTAGKFWEEAWWLLGDDGEKVFASLETETKTQGSRAYPEGGFYFMRDGDLYLAIDCGPVGLRGRGGHGHNDALSFELGVGSQTFITDTGTYVYTADPNTRNEFRSTRAHNTVVVDDQEIAVLGDEHRLWYIADQAQPACLEWEIGKDFDFFVGEHRGYQRLFDPVMHRRSIYFDKCDQFWFFQDALEGNVSHQADLYFHFHPGCEIFLDEQKKSVRVASGRSGIMLLSLDDSLDMSLVNSWFSRSYGVREQSQALKISKSCRFPARLSTLILYYNDESSISRRIEYCLEKLHRLSTAKLGASKIFEIDQLI